MSLFKTTLLYRGRYNNTRRERYAYFALYGRVWRERRLRGPLNSIYSIISILLILLRASVYNDNIAILPRPIKLLYRTGIIPGVWCTVVANAVKNFSDEAGGCWKKNVKCSKKYRILLLLLLFKYDNRCRSITVEMLKIISYKLWIN